MSNSDNESKSAGVPKPWFPKSPPVLVGVFLVIAGISYALEAAGVLPSLVPWLCLTVLACGFIMVAGSRGGREERPVDSLVARVSDRGPELPAMENGTGRELLRIRAALDDTSDASPSRLK